MSLTKRKSKLWLAVSDDEYELPVFVAGSIYELAAKMNVKESTIQKGICRRNHGKKSRYLTVEVEE